MTNKELIIEKILANIESLDIAWYLKEDVKKVLWYFHYYKLKNLVNNMDFLMDYLFFLDHKSTTQIHKLEHIYEEKKDIWDRDIHYYVSKKWLDIVWHDKIVQKVLQNDFNLNSVMLWIKGFLLLTVDEFCNSTPMRLSINKLMWEKELLQ